MNKPDRLEVEKLTAAYVEIRDKVFESQKQLKLDVANCNTAKKALKKKMLNLKFKSVFVKLLPCSYFVNIKSEDGKLYVQECDS